MGAAPNQMHLEAEIVIMIQINTNYCCADNEREEAKVKKSVRQPRIELGAQRWQRWILPLNHWHLILQCL